MCSGSQTVARELANKGHFRLTFRANKGRPGLTIPANEPTLSANSLQTVGRTHIRCQYDLRSSSEELASPPSNMLAAPAPVSGENGRFHQSCISE
jgi:hypothetical protein